MDEVTYKLSFRDFIIASGIPGFILLIRPVIMALISRQRSLSEMSAVDTSASIQIAMAAVAFSVAIFLFKKDPTFRRLVFHTPFKWFVIYTFWCAVTALWSENGLISAYRAFEALAWALLVGALLSRLLERLNAFKLITWILIYAVFDIFVNIFINLFRFGYPIFSMTNLMNEQFRSTAYFFLALLLPVGWLFRLTILPISIFSLSNTAYVGMAGGLLPLITAKGKWRRTFFLISITVLIAISVVGTEEVLRRTIFYGQPGVGVEFTTGRDNIANAAVNRAMEKPFIGHGFVTGEVAVVKSRSVIMGVHNGFLAALVGTGFLGLTLFVIYFISLVLTARSQYLPHELRIAFLSSTILITIHTMGNPGLGSRVYGTWLPAMLVFTLICVIQLDYKYQHSIIESNLDHK